MRDTSRSSLRGAVLASAFVVAAAQAGHGLINSFAGLEWLPLPGTTPDAVSWPLDRADEAARRLLARDMTARLALLRAHARERLAELDAMVRAGEPAAARRAVAAYAALLEEWTPLLATAAPALLRSEAEELLAHQYMLSTNYLDLPRDTRPLILPMLDAAAAHYLALKARLPAGVRDALFFKEEEVRWSREMALAADEQGL